MYISTYCQNNKAQTLNSLTQTMKLKPNQTLFYGTKSNLTLFFIKKHFIDLKNQNFLVLWLKSTQTMELK